jgi:hypothetical protein
VALAYFESRNQVSFFVTGLALTQAPSWFVTFLLLANKPVAVALRDSVLIFLVQTSHLALLALLLEWRERRKQAHGLSSDRKLLHLLPH